MVNARPQRGRECVAVYDTAVSLAVVGDQRLSAVMSQRAGGQGPQQ